MDRKLLTIPTFENWVKLPYSHNVFGRHYVFVNKYENPQNKKLFTLLISRDHAYDGDDEFFRYKIIDMYSKNHDTIDEESGYSEEYENWDVCVNKLINELKGMNDD